MSIFPPEIHGRILENVEDDDLASLMLVCRAYRLHAAKRIYKFVNIDAEQHDRVARFAGICKHEQVGVYVRALEVAKIHRSNPEVHDILFCTPNLVNLTLSWGCQNEYRTMINPPRCLPTEPKFRLKRLTLDMFNDITVDSLVSFIHIHRDTLQELQLLLRDRSITYPVLQDTYHALRLCSMTVRTMSLDIMNRHALRCSGWIPALYTGVSPSIVAIGFIELGRVDQRFAEQFPNLRHFTTQFMPSDRSEALASWPRLSHLEGLYLHVGRPLDQSLVSNIQVLFENNPTLRVVTGRDVTTTFRIFRGQPIQQPDPDPECDLWECYVDEDFQG